METLLAAVILLLILGLDAWAIYKLAKVSGPTQQQKMLQTAIILAIPILGSVAILIFLKPGKDYDRGDFPKDPGMQGNVYGSGIDTRLGPH
jgi:hypothetical protein